MTSSEMIKISTDNPGKLFSLTKEAALPGFWKPGMDLGKKIINYGKSFVKPTSAKSGLGSSIGGAIQGTGNFIKRNIGNPQQGWKNFGQASKRMIIGGGVAYAGYKGVKELAEEANMKGYDMTLRNRLGAGLMDPSQVPEEKLNEIYGVRNPNG